MSEDSKKIAVYDAINLEKHANIMASAGTGKTYTIQNLILRLILKFDLDSQAPETCAFRYDLREVLVVTYTEKATGELKDRIRAKLVTALRKMKLGESCDGKDDGVPCEQGVLLSGDGKPYYPAQFHTQMQSHLEKQILNFDQAKIFTIHGFCQRVLQENALAAGMPMQLEVTDGVELSTRIVRDWWNKEFDSFDSLEQQVILSQVGNVEKLLKGFKDILLGIDDVDYLYPKIEVDSASELKNQRLELFKVIETKEPEIAKIENEIVSLNKKLKNTVKTLGQKSKALSLEVFSEAIELVKADDQPKWQSLKRLINGEKFQIINRTVFEINDFEHLNKIIPKGGLYKLTKKVSTKLNEDPNWEIFFENVQTYYDYQAELKKINSQNKNLKSELKAIKNEIFISLVQQIFVLNSQDDSEEGLGLITFFQNQIKESGLLTFNSMVSKTAEILSPREATEIELARSKALIDELRKQYKYAIIDEFQDTSFAQWQVFKPLFLDNKTKERNLLVVGDSKQSIYSFQGAELKTCNKAIDEIKDANGEPYELGQNFRSRSELIEAYDSLFKQPSWFGVNNTNEIEEYPGVESGKGVKNDGFFAKESPSSKATGVNKPIWLLRLDEVKGKEEGKEGNKEAKSKVLAQWTVHHINWLIKSQGVQPNEIAVLIQKRKEGTQITADLRALGIPVSLGSEAGLFEGEVGKHFTVLLEALVHEDQEYRNKAFLTRFFGLSVQEIKPQTGDVEVLDKDRFGKGYQEALIEIENWRKLVSKGSWGVLFSTIEKAWQYMPSSDEVEHATVRSDRSALRQLVSYALKRILGKGESFEVFIRRLRSLNMGVIKEGEEEDQFYKETSLPAVTVMTLHGSKGLEFPYVFLPTGAGSLWSPPDSLCTTISKGGGREYHLDKEDVKEEAATADMQEWARLFYVAFTRAEKWMAIPYWGKGNPRFKTPASQFLNKSILGALDEKPELFEEFSIDESSWREIKTPQAAGALPAADEDSSGSIKQIVKKDFEATAIPKKRQKVGASFTKISETGSVKVKQDVIQQELEADLPAGTYENDEGEDLSTQAIEISEDSLWANLPRGKYAGNLIHEILERTDFRIFHTEIYEDANYTSQLNSWRKEVLVPQCIKQKVGAYGPQEERLELYNNVEKIICNLLQNPIQFPGLSFDGLSLTELAPSKLMNHSLQSSQKFEKGTYIAEPDFWYPFGTEDWKFDPNASNNPGWFTGSVDLFFEIGNEYYVLDWKTNTLEDYNSNSLDKAMVKKKYIWQAALYGEAMQRWFKSLGSDYKVKGALYYFVRGVEVPNSQSMWYKSIENLAEYETEITQQKAHVIHKFLGKSTDAEENPSEEEQA